MTGSAGWAYYSATQYMLGVRPGFDELQINPCVPADWKSFSVSREWRGACFRIHVENPDGLEKGVKAIYLNGNRVERIGVQPEGSVHEVRVIMG